MSMYSSYNSKHGKTAAVEANMDLSMTSKASMPESNLSGDLSDSEDDDEEVSICFLSTSSKCVHNH